jgi:hypothetical protein
MSTKTTSTTGEGEGTLTALAQQVREFISSGRADSALAAMEPEREHAVSALSNAEQIDPNKLRQTVSI